MRFAFSIAFAVFATLLLTGCARTEKFDVSVRNDTSSPLTLALTKDGPPFEHVWAGPEDLAEAAASGGWSAGTRVEERYQATLKGVHGPVRAVRLRADGGAPSAAVG